MTNELNPAITRGIVLRVTSSELAAHMRARAEYHKKRAAEKEGQLPALRKAAEELAPQKAASVTNFTKVSGGNYSFSGDEIVKELERDVETHHNRSLFFAWAADHVVPGQYELTRGDLTELEIIRAH